MNTENRGNQTNDESPELPLTGSDTAYTHLTRLYRVGTTVRLPYGFTLSLYGGSGKDPTKVKYAGARRRREDHGGVLATEVRYFGVKSCCRPRAAVTSCLVLPTTVRRALRAPRGGLICAWLCVCDASVYRRVSWLYYMCFIESERYQISLPFSSTVSAMAHVSGRTRVHYIADT